MFTLILFILGLQPLHELGYKGEGIKIAVIDGGFYHANDSTVFDQNRIKGVFDLLPDSIKGKGIFNDPDDIHGTCCLSTMLYSSASWTGTAPEADYYLIRTEYMPTETPDEVDRLIDGLWLADSLGANIITISLGYSQFDDSTQNYNYNQMDGLCELSQAATQIAQRNRLICVAAGNEGNKPWHYITSPADADSILAVGACDSTGMNVASFSGWGPSADGRIKPEVCAWGQYTIVYQPTQHVLENGTYIGGLGRGSGTSFATPEIAGMAACLWQALPHVSAMEIRRRIIRSCSQYNHPDNHWGYGIPDAWKAYQDVYSGLQTNDSDYNEVEKYIRDNRLVIRILNHEYDIMGNKIK